MNISQQLQKDLAAILCGDPWYGSNVYTIIEQVGFETAFERAPGSVHNIAGIVLHMLSWTEEVIDRMNGQTAQLPSSGDWPDPGAPDEQKWQTYINDLKLVNVNLLGVIQNFEEEKWMEHINDKRNDDTAIGVNYHDLVKGLIQHHVYHSAQIALMNRMVAG